MSPSQPVPPSADDPAQAPRPEPSETVGLIMQALQRSARSVARGTADETADGSSDEGGMRPDLIPGYRIVRHLGRGGMADVYEAVHLRLRRRVALKILMLDDERRELAPRFLREARAMMQVRHLNVTTIHEIGSTEGLHYLALEFITGGDLAAYIDRHGPLPVDEAITMMIACCEGLAAIHAAGLVHRDLKPANIFLGKDREPKIGDFGLARQSSGADRMTVTGASWGTPSYMAPEQIVGDADVDARADLYALGATFYCMVTKHEPFSGSTAYLTTFKAMTEPFPDPRVLNPQVPASVAAIIRTATMRERAARYPSALSLRDDLIRTQRQQMLLHAGTVATSASATGVPTVDITTRAGSTALVRGPRQTTTHPATGPSLYGWRGVLLAAVAVASIAWWWPSLGSPPDEPAFPSWATGGGRDGAGRWVELRIGDASTRLRHRPAGSFRMGSPLDEAGRSVVEAQRDVTLTTGFWIQETECDQAFYVAVMGTNPSRHRGADLPVEQVTWEAAQEFCAALAERGVPARLPTEAEWEYACRAGNSQPYAHSEPSRVGWIAEGALLAAWRQADDGEAAAQRLRAEQVHDLTLRAHPVARLRPNAAGLFDMHGNVLEWCADRWDGRAVPASVQTDPRSEQGDLVIARGGSWFHPPEQARSAARLAFPPATREDHLGFRFVVPDTASGQPTDE